MSAAELLRIENLRVSFAGDAGRTEAVRGVGFAMGREKLGIVGESGSGKSLTAQSVLRLLPPGATMSADTLRFDGTDLMALSPRAMRRIRGRRIGLIPQDPKFALNPVMTIGRQIAEAVRLIGATRTAAKERTLDLLRDVGIEDARRVARAYPHELSGGMAQRAMIAMMIAPDPALLIADEPTSALDVSVRRQVLDILDGLIEGRGMGLVFISHDLGLVGAFCDRVLVMYAGQIVERCEARELAEAHHPYTRGLLTARPRFGEPVAALPVLERDPAWLDDGERAP
jgi:peptide/nickel transport system ATP-binding protein